MSFQAGICYFDERPIVPAEIAAVRDCVCRDESSAPRLFAAPGLLVAHSDSSPEQGRSAVLSFDGRIDNRADLSRRLGRTEPAGDAALALAAYETWGIDGFAHLVGDWSLALRDARRQSLVLASDYAGVRPLYYCAKDHRVRWSTRLAPLVTLAGTGELDEIYMAGLIAFTGSPDRTPYRGIYSVPPACAVQLTASGASVSRFWRLPVTARIRYAAEAEYEEELRALFREAVRSRLRAGARCLSELSGGLDSSSVVCMAADVLRRGEAKPARFSTLTVEHPGSRDAPFYRAVERHCGFESLHVPAAEYPFTSQTETGGALPGFWAELQKHTTEVARGIDATTYLTGKLGDEIMGNWWDDSEQVAGLLRAGHVGAGLRQSLAWSRTLRIPVAWILARALRSSLPARLMAAPGNRLSPVPETARDLEDSIAPALRQRARIAEPHRLFSTDWMQARPERRRHCRALIQFLELRRLQAPEPFAHLDYSHPFAHRPLVSFMLGIPAAVVCGPGEPRRLMRRALQRFWPAELRRRRSKDSFGGVFLNALRPLAAEMLKPGRAPEVVERGYVDAASLKRRLERMTLSMPCNEPQLRQIILLEFWLRNLGAACASEAPAPAMTADGRSRTRR